MVKYAFILTCGFIIGALVIENKQYFSNRVPVPVAVLADGGVYEGELSKAQLHGQGKLVWPDGSYYEGQFADGVFQGKGVLHTPAFVYEGEFDLGQPSGEGSITYVNGDKYQGSVKLGLPNGSGVLETANSTYTGEFKDKRYHGHGELVMKSGDSYVGDFEQGLFHGKGVFSQPIQTEGAEPEAKDGDAEQVLPRSIFSGSFVKGEFTGEGMWVEGEQRYEGAFLNWEFHGEGMYSDPEGTYTGPFVKGVYQGQGVYVGSQGMKYEGGFANGRYHGTGVLTNEDGDVYTGGFQFGTRHGEGRLVYAQPLDGISEVNGEWEYDRLIKSEHPQLVVEKGQLVEHALYNQSALLQQHLDGVQEQNPEQIELFFVGIAGDGSQGVFRREMDFVSTLFADEYEAKNKSISLINSPLSHREIPLATVTSIEKTLQDVAAKMDPENDILFLFMTSHGTQDFRLYLGQPGLELSWLAAEDLGKIVKSLPVKHKVVLVSACYSGGFVKPLKDDSTMVITAAEADKTSFGCSDRSTMTYFGEAFFKDALHQSESFVDAFYRARDIVKGREAKDGFENSNPLIYKPKAIVAHLKKWREQLAARKAESEKSEQPAAVTEPTKP